MRLSSQFSDLVMGGFDFLETDFSCSLDHVGTGEATGDCDVRWRNDTTFVNAHLEQRDSQLIVYLGPLASGAVPPQPRGWYDLGFLLLARGIPSPEHGGRLGQLNNRARRREIEDFAHALRLGAADVLRGDFEVFELVRAIIEERRKFLDEPEVKQGRLR